MKCIVRARDEWDSTLQNRFGDMGTLHELSDTEVVAIIMEFGRAEIQKCFPQVITMEGNAEDVRPLEFHNSYD